MFIEFTKGLNFTVTRLDSVDAICKGKEIPRNNAKLYDKCAQISCSYVFPLRGKIPKFLLLVFFNINSNLGGMKTQRVRGLHTVTVI